MKFLLKHLVSAAGKAEGGPGPSGQVPAVTEFDLIHTDNAVLLRTLEITSQGAQGAAGLPVLDCWLGRRCWADKPEPTEIPGWRALTATDTSAPWEMTEDEKQFKWQGQVLFSLRSAVQETVELEQLKGLTVRPGDDLPEGLDQAVEIEFQLLDGTHLYGLGQRSGPLERSGLQCHNWTTDSPVGHNRVTDPLYQAHPLLWGVTGEVWWAMLFCHSGYSSFDLAQSKAQTLKVRLLGSSVNFQLHAERSPQALLASLRQTLADPTPPPLWALGFHQSRWGYKSAREIDELIDTFRGKRLPLDVVHLDIDHMDDYRSFTFDPAHFPDPAQRFADWKAKGVRVVTIIDPGLKFDPSGHYEPLQEGLQGNHFIRSNSGAPVVGYCWPDEALFPDYAREATRQWWARQCQFYLDHGVSGLWIDMNEPAIFDQPFWSGRAKQQPMPLDTPWGEDHKRLDHLRLRNLYGSLMAQATRAAWASREERAWVLTRSGFTGVGAEAYSWMGDNTSWWEHLALSLPQLSSMSLVNSSFVGVDIGGFFGNADAGLYSAWIEASPIYPFMRAHSALGTAEQHPWSYGTQVEEVARQALNLRYRLLPYLYQAMMEHCEGGLPVLRPMFFDFPHVEEFRFLEDQVMFGAHMVAAPFVHRGAEQRMVLLPAGTWYDFHSGELLHSDGSGFVIRRRPGLVPLFVKAGAVVPTLEGEVQNTEEASEAAWELLHFPGEDELKSRVYWDAGNGWAFREGDCLKVDLVNLAGQLSVNRRHLGGAFAAHKVRVTRPGCKGAQTTFAEL